MAEERRLHTRFTIDQCVTLSFAHEDFIDARGINLSKGGLLFRSAAPIDIYQKIFVMLNVPAGTIKAEGIVVHSVAEGGASVYGLRFTDIAEEYRVILDEYCKSDTGTDPDLTPPV